MRSSFYFQKVMHIFPAINATSFEEAKELIEKAKTFVPEKGWVHIDVADGVFTDNELWGSPEDLLRMRDTVKNIGVEVHLMVAEPEAVVEDWAATGLVHRIVVHIEGLTDPGAVLEICQRYGVEAVLALTPPSKVERLTAFFGRFKHFQVLAVTPGLPGQRFNPEVINKVKFLRSQAPNATIEVDGGINPETGKQCKDAGADILVSASYIFESPDAIGAYENLAKL